jgi:hypothetical protein
MSSRQTGNRHENEAADSLHAIGYWTFAARGSRTPIDLLCVHRTSRLIVAVQVGTANKSATAALREMRLGDAPAGTIFVVARRCKRSGRRIEWRWHWDIERRSWSTNPATAIAAALAAAA